MYSPGGSFIMVAPVVTSWAVAGQQLVFLHMYLQTRVTLTAFPIATPRGRSSKFPWRGTIWPIGKLKRVKSNRDGAANVVLYKSLKNIHEYWCEGNWTIFIQARGILFLRHRDDDRFFKVGGNHRGSKGLIKDGLKVASWPARDLRTRLSNSRFYIIMFRLM